MLNKYLFFSSVPLPAQSLPPKEPNGCRVLKGRQTIAWVHTQEASLGSGLGNGNRCQVAVIHSDKWF